MTEHTRPSGLDVADGVKPAAPRRASNPLVQVTTSHIDQRGALALTTRTIRCTPSITGPEDLAKIKAALIKNFPGEYTEGHMIIGLFRYEAA